MESERRKIMFIIGFVLLILAIGFGLIFLLPAIFTIALTILFIFVFYKLFRYLQDKLLNKDV